MKESQVRSSLIGKPWKGSQRSDTTDSQFYNSVHWAFFFFPKRTCQSGEPQKRKQIQTNHKSEVSEENDSQGILDTGMKDDFPKDKEESKSGTDETGVNRSLEAVTHCLNAQGATFTKELHMDVLVSRAMLYPLDQN